MDFKDLTINNTVSAKANLNLIYFRPPAKAGGNSDGGNSDGDKQELALFFELPPFSNGGLLRILNIIPLALAKLL